MTATLFFIAFNCITYLSVNIRKELDRKCPNREIGRCGSQT